MQSKKDTEREREKREKKEGGKEERREEEREIFVLLFINLPISILSLILLQKIPASPCLIENKVSFLDLF